MRRWSSIIESLAAVFLVWAAVAPSSPVIQDQIPPCGAIHVVEAPYVEEITAAREALESALLEQAEQIAAEEALGREWVFEDGSTMMISETLLDLEDRWRQAQAKIMARYYGEHPEMDCSIF